ncbi:MAG: hypothetical protein WAU78_06390, partial [Roseiarcus sp.]
SRMTSYFTRSASLQGIANLPKLLQTQGINSREAGQPISGRALSLFGVRIIEADLSAVAGEHQRYPLTKRAAADDRDGSRYVRQ